MDSEEPEYYNDGGKHDNCTKCGKPVEFTKEETRLIKSGNILYPQLMPMKDRLTKIKHWKCLSCGETGQNFYLPKE